MVDVPLSDQPRLSFATLPTPLQDALRLRTALGGAAACPRILIKRDDLTGLALGGNKVRKLEFVVADALQEGATVLVTTGATQSNHARMTAACARLAGMQAVLILTSTETDPPVQGNLLLDHLLGAEIHLVPPSPDAHAVNEEEQRVVAEVLGTLAHRGERPYLIPLGASDATGTLGYVAATLELLGQLHDIRVAPTRLYYASGSRGTQAGLALGAALFHAPYRCRGIAVSPGDPEKTQRAVQIAREAATMIGADISLGETELFTDQGYIGGGYAVPTAGCQEAIRLLALTEAIFADPVYTGKALAGLIADIRSGAIDPSETVVFLHTGGVPAIFAQVAQLGLVAASAEEIASPATRARNDDRAQQTFHGPR